MKKLLTLALLVYTFHANAQVTWSAPVAVATSTYSNLHPRISLDRNGNPLVLWGNSSSRKAFFSKWTGSTFSTPIALNPMMTDLATASWQGPDIVSYGDTVYVAMKQMPEDTGHMYVVRSVNGGSSFSMPVKVDMPGYVSRFPILATDASGNPIAAFMKFNASFGNARYVVSKSTDYGMSFPMDILATKTGDTVCDCCPASILASGNNVVMSYRANRNNTRDIWSIASTNGGTSFTNSILVDQTSWMIMACPSSGPDAVIIGDSLYTVFMSSASGKALTYFNKASLSAATAAPNTPITGNFSGLNSQNFPRIASAGKATGIVWVQNQNSSTRIVMKFSDDITKGLPAIYDTIAMGTVVNADITMSNGTIHIVWQDDNSGTVKYRKGTYNSTSIPEITNRSYISVYPNPASSSFSIILKNGSEIRNCILMDNTGKQIAVNTTRTGDSMNVRIEELPTGVYYVLFSDSIGNKFYSKFIKQTK